MNTNARIDNVELVLHMLISSVEAIEKELHPIGPPTPVGAIRFRMEAMGMNQSDLARTIGCPRSRVSEIMRGKRGLTLPLIRTLHTKLGIPLESLVGLGKTTKRRKK